VVIAKLELPRQGPPSECEPSGQYSPAQQARQAGLRYVSDAEPGIRRLRAGRGFRYVGPDGDAIRDSAELRRIRALVIPPAWTDVWICPSSRGHIQATGRDGRGRKQYRYHSAWQVARDETKYERMAAFGAALPGLRRQVAEDLARRGLPREKVLATVVELLDTTCIRIGNAEYARQNDSYGLTTLRTQHVALDGGTVRFRFRGKSGKRHDVSVRDRRVARILQRCQSLPGQPLFQYLDATGQPKTIDSEDVNEYLRLVTGEDFTAKDFRTWAGSVLAASTLAARTPPESEAERTREIAAAVRQVADRLGNTAAVCRRAYIHPAVFEAYAAGTLRPCWITPGAGGGREVGLQPDEQAILALLQGPPGPDARASAG
jgi:DNA topoisomerase-1